jgi:hypothetical protein
MDPSIVMNLAALVVSVAALTVSIAFALRQLRMSRGANLLPVILQAFRDVRDADFGSAQQYIHDELPRQYDAALGWRGLPVEVRNRIRTVILFYDDLGKTVAHGAIDEDLIVGSYGYGLQRTWRALEPFIRTERQLRNSNFLVYMEHLASRVERLPPEQIYRRLGLEAEIRDVRRPT